MSCSHCVCVCVYVCVCAQDCKPSTLPPLSDHMQTSAQATPAQEPTVAPVPEPTPGGGAIPRKRSVSSNPHPSLTDNSASSVVKSEPQSPEHTRRSPPPTAASKSSPAASISSKSSLSPPPNNKTPPHPSDPPDPKRRKVLARKSSEALRPPPPRKSSFGSPVDCSDDLKLSAEDCHSITNSTAKLLRPLEEAEATKAAVSSSPTSSNGAVGSKLSSSSLLPPPSTIPHSAVEDASFLQHELDEFSKVMAQVTQEETAKEKERGGSSAYAMLHFDLPNSPYLGSPGLPASSPMFSSPQVYSRTSGSLDYSSNGQPNYVSMGSRQPPNGIGDPTYRYAQQSMGSAQLDSIYAQTVQHLQSPMTCRSSSQTSLVNVCTNNTAPFSDHISLSGEHYRQISSLSSPLDHFTSSHHLPSPHPSYGQSSASYGYVGTAGVSSVGPDWSHLSAQDAILTRVGTHPESVAYMAGKMPPSAGAALRASSNVQPQRQYQAGYTGPSNQSFPHTMSYGRFSNQM